MYELCSQCVNIKLKKTLFCPGCGEMLHAESRTTLLDNRYEILDMVKTVSSGCIYKARDIRLDTIVAIRKMINHSIPEHEEVFLVHRFWEKARELTTFNHPALPRIVNFFTGRAQASSRTACYLVAEFLDGGNLGEYVRERKESTFTQDEILVIFRRLLTALMYLHGRTPAWICGVMSPTNIMVCRDEAYLAGFGISDIFASPGAGQEEQAYRAPEQRGGIMDPRSDLYSLAAVMHFIITGEDPRDGVTLQGSVDNALVPGQDLPGCLVELIGAMSERDLEKRPPSAEAALRKLDEALNPPTIEVKESPPPLEIPVLSRETSAPSPAEMLNAIRYRDFSTMEKYITGGGDMNVITYRGSTLLHAATEKGDPETLELFLKGPVDINYAGKIGWTALHLATITGDIKIGKLLITHGANLNAANDEGITPLHRVIHWGHEEFMRLLITSGANPDCPDKLGMTPLHHAVMKKKVNMQKILIANGANMNHADKSGATPLHLAAAEDNQDAMKLLILSGADVNVRNGMSLTPLHQVAQKGYSIAVDLLVAKGADVNAKDARGQTPLHLAAQGDFSMVSYLITHGADIKARDLRGTTPLQQAVSKGRRENVSVLRKYGA